MKKFILWFFAAIGVIVLLLVVLQARASLTFSTSHEFVVQKATHSLTAEGQTETQTQEVTHISDGIRFDPSLTFDIFKKVE